MYVHLYPQMCAPELVNTCVLDNSTGVVVTKHFSIFFFPIKMANYLIANSRDRFSGSPLAFMVAASFPMGARLEDIGDISGDDGC